MRRLEAGARTGTRVCCGKTPADVLAGMAAGRRPGCRRKPWMVGNRLVSPDSNVKRTLVSRLFTPVRENVHQQTLKLSHFVPLMLSSDPIEETVQQSLAIIKRGIDELLVEAELAAKLRRSLKHLLMSYMKKQYSLRERQTLRLYHDRYHD